MTDREVMQQALETAEGIANADYRHWQELSSLAEFERWARSRSNHIAELLRARLSQCDRCGKVNPAEIHTYTPKPVAWGIENTRPTEKQSLMMVMLDEPEPSHLVVPLYTAPPQREWVGLTKEELADIAEFHFHGAFSARDIYEDIETRLKEKNT